MTKVLTAAFLLGASVVSAHADFWVVQDTTSGQCRVVQQRPSDTTAAVVGSVKGYSTRVQADNQRKTIEICKEVTTGGPNPKLLTDTPLR
jgi:hypothetical protein